MKKLLAASTDSEETEENTDEQEIEVESAAVDRREVF